MIRLVVRHRTPSASSADSWYGLSRHFADPQATTLSSGSSSSTSDGGGSGGVTPSV
jgi:hypothetical protein